jgi:hypothetical protein
MPGTTFTTAIYVIKGQDTSRETQRYRRRLQERGLALSAGRQSFALKRILEAVFVIFLREVEKSQIFL